MVVVNVTESVPVKVPLGAEIVTSPLVMTAEQAPVVGGELVPPAPPEGLPPVEGLLLLLLLPPAELVPPLAVEICVLPPLAVWELVVPPTLDVPPTPVLVVLPPLAVLLLEVPPFELLELLFELPPLDVPPLEVLLVDVFAVEPPTAAPPTVVLAVELLIALPPLAAGSCDEGTPLSPEQPALKLDTHPVTATTQAILVRHIGMTA